MDHTHAVDSHAAERYLLGELPEPERDAFEEHYFDCQACAVAVESGSVFIDNACAVFSEPKLSQVQPEKQHGNSWFKSFANFWRQPSFALPAMAALAFGAIALYQAAVVVPGLRRGLETPRILPAFQLIGASRGDTAPLDVPAGAQAFAVSFDIPPGFQFAQYDAALLSPENSTQPIFQITSPAPAPGQPITLLLPAGKLKSGSYTLDVGGLNNAGARNPVARYMFALKIH